MIIGDDQRRAMEFIATANLGGHQPTAREINEWRLRPNPQPGRKGPLLHAAVPGTPERRVRKPGTSGIELMFADLAKTNSAIFKQWSSVSAANFGSIEKLIGNWDSSAFAALSRSLQPIFGEYETIPGTPGKPAVYGPAVPPEKFLAHLRRLGWVERDARKGYRVTSLGHALLRAEARAASGSDDGSSVLLLDAGDELAYGQVLGVIAECGDALIIDGYLDAAELVHILKDSNASRFLVSSKLSKARLTALALQIRLTPPDEHGTIRELRRTDLLHDRYVVGDKVYGLGSSLNGVGKSMTTLVLMNDPVIAQGIRERAEGLWDGAEVVAWTGEHEEADEPERIISEVGGIFTHVGCDTKHRSKRAALRCPKGD